MAPASASALLLRLHGAGRGHGRPWAQESTDKTTPTVDADVQLLRELADLALFDAARERATELVLRCNRSAGLGRSCIHFWPRRSSATCSEA